MKHRILLLISAFTLLAACRAPLNVSQVETRKNIALTADLPENEIFKKVIEPYKMEVEGKMNTKISHTSVDLNKQGDNSNLGNLLADYTLQGADAWAKSNGIAGGVDAAVINIGGIRSTIGAGDILTRHVYEVMPFENEVVIVKLKGSDLEGLFEYYLKTQKNNPVAQIYIETDNGAVTKKLINGKEIVPSKDYYIATSDYLALGGDNMNFFGKGEMISTGIRLRELFLEKFQANPEIVPPTDIRLNFKNKKNRTDG